MPIVSEEDQPRGLRAVRDSIAAKLAQRPAADAQGRYAGDRVAYGVAPVEPDDDPPEAA